MEKSFGSVESFDSLEKWSLEKGIKGPQVHIIEVPSELEEQHQSRGKSERSILRFFSKKRRSKPCIFFSVVSGILLLVLIILPSVLLTRRPDTLYLQDAAIKTNFMDPSFLEVNGTYYAFAGANGNPAGIHVQIASSNDFSSWTVQAGYDALPIVANWVANQAHVWAPAVRQRPDGSFVMYYSASNGTHARKHCIGAATSPTVMGPYTPINSTIVCDIPLGGNIDPYLFQDPATSDFYLVYKVDGNSIGSGGACDNSKQPRTPTPLRMQRLQAPNLTEAMPGFEPYDLLNLSDTDGPNIEGPCMFANNGTYYLLYNSGCFHDQSYRIRYVACEGAANVSECAWSDLEAAQGERTLIGSGYTTAKVHAPGGIDVLPADPSKIIFHGDLNLAWFKHDGNKQTRVRGMYAAELLFKSDGVLDLGRFYY